MAGQRHSATRWREVAVQAGRQHGVVARWQLRRLGVDDATIDRAISSGRLYPIFRGAFGVGHRPEFLRARLVAATLACGEGSVVSHGTAAALLGLWEQQPLEIDVIAPVEAGRKIAGIRRRHVPAPDPGEIWVHHAVPCTAPGRTVVDVAGICKEAGVRGILEQAAVMRMLSIPEIDAVLDGPRRRGARLLKRTLELWRRYPPGMVVRSRMEARLLPLLTEYGVPVPKVNAKAHFGGERFELDFHWPRARLVVESDGGRFHGNPAAAARDAHRDRVLRAAGLRVWRLTWNEVAYRPEQTMAELHRLLRDRSRTPPH